MSEVKRVQRIVTFSCIVVVLGGLLPAALAQQPAPSPTPPIFDPRPLGVLPKATPTPRRKAAVIEDERPLPRGWKIAGGIAAVVAAAGLAYGGSRAWRSANIFDREYTFPVRREAAVRFGAEKCGGHMATVRFRPERRSAGGSKPKDA